MKEVFADTQGWIALSHKRDQFNQKAVKTVKETLEQGRIFITTNFVLNETYTLLKVRLNHKSAVAFGEMVRSTSGIRILHITESIEQEAWQLFKKYSDKEFSFTDCTSFVVMQMENITEAFRNDHHFEQMGFSILLK
jgi:predicted nucleic acid-binding protein